MSFDPTSLSRIARLAGFEAYLSDGVHQALVHTSQLLAEKAQENTWTAFMHPTGALADTISAETTSPYEAQVVVMSPYGHRREYSFKGPDALGRMFPNDPAEPYLGPALEENQAEALGEVIDAVNAALGRIVV